MSEPLPEPVTEDTMIAGLLRERETLVARGLSDRVAQVDEQLTLRGYTPAEAAADDTPAEAEPHAQAPAEAKPRGRRAPGRATT